MMKNVIAISVLIVLTLSAGYFIAGGNKLNTGNDQKTNDLSFSLGEGAGNQNSGLPSASGDNMTNDSANINNQDNLKAMKATLHTNKGDIVIELFEETPNTTSNFTKLANEGFYDETKFHRVIEGFMNQGGDPLSKDDSKQAMWGTGGPGYKFNDEITDSNNNDRGTISMANAGPNTNGSQFFINVADNNFLDTKHTVFGIVVSGMDVVDAINKVATDSNDRPTDPVVIKNITLE